MAASGDARPAPALRELLERTSRTFALTIPLLPEPTRGAVTTAYLLFRIADTFEDATTWPVALRTKALGEFSSLLDEPDEAEARALARRWAADPPLTHDGYIDLLERTPVVMAAFRGLRPSSRAIVREHVQRTIEGMAGYVERAPDGAALELRDIEDLRAYCYVVAGIVGEMLTELFLDQHPGIAAVGPHLRERARHFGEALQLTNILKDALTDATEGRRFLPDTAPRERVFQLARDDLARAREYVLALQESEAPRGLVAFTALPVLLAIATLDRVETLGPGAKLTRPEVAGVMQRMDHALTTGEAVVPDVIRSRRPK